jgi:hypothetical protein
VRILLATGDAIAASSAPPTNDDAFAERTAHEIADDLVREGHLLL